jgi:AraC-like DNA-binding protein
LRKAKQFLDVTGNHVADVAYLVGLSSPNYISTCFKEKYGVSPSDYLKLKDGHPMESSPNAISLSNFQTGLSKN